MMRSQWINEINEVLSNDRYYHFYYVSSSLSKYVEPVWQSHGE